MFKYYISWLEGGLNQNVNSHDAFRLIMRTKLTDERKYQRERKRKRNEKRDKLTKLTSKNQLERILSVIMR